MDQVLVRQIKWSTVGIGVHNYTDNDIIMVGSGFYYDTRGYLMSAAHVLRCTEKLNNSLKLKNKKSKMIATNLNVLDGDKAAIQEDEIEKILLPAIKTEIEHPTTPVLFDVGIGKIIPSRSKYPFLKIKQIVDLTAPHLDIGHEVVMCGYPAGEESLSLKIDAYHGYRFSPVMQFGHISALLPSDDAIPYGIQTDILSTGGSSGSPIVSIETGEVIGLAQKIISTYAAVGVPEKAQHRVKMPDKLEGFAHIGIVYGDSYHMLGDIPNLTKDSFEDGDKGISHASYSKVFVRPEFGQDGITLNLNDL